MVRCFNEAAYLPDTLRSLQAQTFGGSYEIVVVDNNSTDATVEVARMFGARVVSEPQPGVCWARQRGTAESKGEIVVSVDADTHYAPDWLDAIDRRFAGDVVAVVGPCRYVGDPAWGRAYARGLFGGVRLWYRFTGRTAYASATNIAFRRSAFPGYNVRMTQGGDELNVLRDLRRSGHIVYDHHNPTYTSSRRLAQGEAYGLFVTLIVYYLLAYYLNRSAGRARLAVAVDSRTADGHTQVLGTGSAEEPSSDGACGGEGRQHLSNDDHPRHVRHTSHHASAPARTTSIDQSLPSTPNWPLLTKHCPHMSTVNRNWLWHDLDDR